MDDDVDTNIASSRPRRYPEEDTSPTTNRELWGWYFYGIAAEAFAVCGPGSFLPVTLEQLARSNGVRWSDRSTPCVGNTKNASERMLAARGPGDDNDQCVVNILGAEITTASFAMYTFSAAVFIQSMALVSFSSVADHGNNRKRLLVAFAMLGSLSGMLFLFIVPGVYLLAPLLAIVAIMSLGCSFVMLNAFLPLLASNHTSVRAQEKALAISSPPPVFRNPDSTAAPLNKTATSPALAFSNTLSARGVGLGYSAAVFVQILCILILFAMSKLHLSTSPTLPLRLALFLASAWWLLFTLPTHIYLRDRPGPPLPVHLHTATETGRIRSILTYITFAWRSLYATLRLALTLRNLRLFLVAWFLVSDAVATVGSTAIMFARTELHLSATGVALLSITATLSGIGGSLLWPFFGRRYGTKSGRTIVYCLCVMEFIPIYGLLGYLPPIQRLGWLGLQQAWEIYPLAVVYGVGMGGLSSYCRSFYGQLVPTGKEAAFYALYAITDKGSSAVGPAVVGRIVDATGTIRPAFVFLLFLIGLPVGLVAWVNEVEGRLEAEKCAEKEEEVELTAREGVREEQEGLMAGRDDEDGRPSR